MIVFRQAKPMVTQKDIARRLGVSPGLVSRVLAGKGASIGAAAATVAAVRREALRLGYVPDCAARRLRGDRTATLGVVAYDFEDPYFGVLLGLLQRAARAAGHSLIVAGTWRRDPAGLDTAPLLKHGIEGLIIVGSDRGKPWLAPFRRACLPVVQIGHTTGRGVSCVAPDEQAGARLLLGHLRSRGHRRLAFLFNDTLPHALRRAHHRRALAALGLPPAPGCDLRCRFDRPESVETAADRLARMRDRPTALVAGDDATALLALRALRARGIRVPEDLHVVGCDDIPAAGLALPSLTTLRPPVEAMAHRAFLAASGCSPLAGESLFAPELVVRESSGG